MRRLAEVALGCVRCQSFVDGAAPQSRFTPPRVVDLQQPNQFVLFYNANLINKKEKKIIEKI